jgi:hypothetical protein
MKPLTEMRLAVSRAAVNARHVDLSFCTVPFLIAGPSGRSVEDVRAPGAFARLSVAPLEACHPYLLTDFK